MQPSFVWASNTNMHQYKPEWLYVPLHGLLGTQAAFPISEMGCCLPMTVQCTQIVDVWQRGKVSGARGCTVRPEESPFFIPEWYSSWHFLHRPGIVNWQQFLGRTGGWKRMWERSDKVLKWLGSPSINASNMQRETSFRSVFHVKIGHILFS